MYYYGRPVNEQMIQLSSRYLQLKYHVDATEFCSFELVQTLFFPIDSISVDLQTQIGLSSLS